MSNLASRFDETGPGVFHARKWGEVVDADLLDELVDRARNQEHGMARICMHPSVDDLEQQMLIACAKTGLGKAHFHPSKREAFLPIVGKARLRFLGEEGEVVSTVNLGAPNAMYVSIPEGAIHDLCVDEAPFVFWEFARGPFTSASTIPAPWAN